MKITKTVIVSVLSFWTIIFAYMILPNEIQIVSDDYPRVILKTRPVDPRDLLRGDYVILSYDFADMSQVLAWNQWNERVEGLREDIEQNRDNPKRLESLEKRLRGLTSKEPSNEGVNEKLRDILNDSKVGDDVYLAFDVGDDRRAITKGFLKEKPSTGLFLKGTVYQLNSWNNSKEVRFGIEKYFVPVGEGRVLEKARNANNLEVEVAVNPKTGKALIVDILIEGVRFEEF